MVNALPHPDVWRADALAGWRQPVAASGWDALDAVLPGGGWPLGALVELVTAAAALPWRLLLPALRAASAQGQVALVGLPLQPNAAAWAAHGIAPQRLWQVQTQALHETLWCAEQLLACPELALCWLHAPHLDMAASRRLQQAASAARRGAALEGGDGWPAPLVVLSRPLPSSGTSAAPLRLQVAPDGPAALAVQVLKRRGPPLARTLRLPAPWAWSEWSHA